MSAADDFTAQERTELAAVAPELAGVSLAELRTLVARYGTSDPALRALAAGQRSPGAIADAVAAADEAAALRHYPTMKPRGR